VNRSPRCSTASRGRSPRGADGGPDADPGHRFGGPCGRRRLRRWRGQPAYTATVDSDPDPPRVEGTKFRILLRRDGRPVTGAKVCFAADMPDMQHPGVSRVARETSGGRYEVDLKFEMGGAWAASVIVAEPGRPVALVRVGLFVR
jgi:hypothetical protein